MVHLVAGAGNVCINLGHAMGTEIVKIKVMNINQMIQHVVCALIMSYTSYMYCFCLILQSMCHQVYSTNIASTAPQ